MFKVQCYRANWSLCNLLLKPTVAYIREIYLGCFTGAAPMSMALDLFFPFKVFRFLRKGHYNILLEAYSRFLEGKCGEKAGVWRLLIILLHNHLISVSPQHYMGLVSFSSESLCFPLLEDKHLFSSMGRNSSHLALCFRVAIQKSLGDCQSVLLLLALPSPISRSPGSCQFFILLEVLWHKYGFFLAPPLLIQQLTFLGVLSLLHSFVFFLASKILLLFFSPLFPWSCGFLT